MAETTTTIKAHVDASADQPEKLREFIDALQAAQNHLRLTNGDLAIFLSALLVDIAIDGFKMLHPDTASEHALSLGSALDKAMLWNALVQELEPCEACLFLRVSMNSLIFCTSTMGRDEEDRDE